MQLVGLGVCLDVMPAELFYIKLFTTTSIPIVEQLAIVFNTCFAVLEIVATRHQVHDHDNTAELHAWLQ